MHVPAAICVLLTWAWLAEAAAWGAPPHPPGTKRAGSHGPARQTEARTRPPQRRPLSYPPVKLVAAAHREHLLFRPYDERGRPRQDARRELTRVLRCPHTGEQRAVDPRLIPILYRLGRHFGRPVVIFSGYRPRRLSTRPRSRHLTAAAIDFQVPGVRHAEVVRWLRRTFHPIGVGFYPDGQHVHLDVDRQRDAYWVQRGSDRLPLAQRLRQTRGTSRHAKT
ncbi:MAG: D-Ala-D-Ala carboxypeptidase family metallohydrolase [Myxococcales bacterium]|nr:D-Ala-D-Ala carboxypeptidase family metallohydrolase [Myxococcales bacterium]